MAVQDTGATHSPAAKTRMELLKRRGQTIESMTIPSGFLDELPVLGQANTHMENPLVSVVIPTFNSERDIGDAIDSVLAQSYSNIEIIVVDDGSTDDTVDIVRGYKRVRLFQQANQGSAVARNLGIWNATGDYVAFLDSDDVWWSRKIEVQVAELRRTGLGMAYSRFIRWHPSAQGDFSPPEQEFANTANPRLSRASIVTGWTYVELLLDCIVWTSTVLVERQLLLQAGLFNPHFRKGQDYDLWLRLSRITQMIGIEQPTALYRIHENSITFRVTDRCYEYEILSNAVATWGEIGPDLRRPKPGAVTKRLVRALFNHGRSHLSYGNPRIAISAFQTLLRRHQANPQALLLLLYAYAKLARRAVSERKPRISC